MLKQDLDNQETLFVIEFIRHGARSHYENNVPKSFFKTQKPGYVTAKGMAEHYRIGYHRRSEYVDNKHFLSEHYNQDEFLSLATFVQRCSTSGLYYLRGLYPLENVHFTSDTNYLNDKHSPIKNTNFEDLLSRIDQH